MFIAEFGNLFGPDTVIIFLLILIFFGAKRLPELMRGCGRDLDEFVKDGREDSDRQPFDLIDWIVVGLFVALIIAAMVSLVA